MVLVLVLVDFPCNCLHIGYPHIGVIEFNRILIGDCFFWAEKHLLSDQHNFVLFSLLRLNVDAKQFLHSFLGNNNKGKDISLINTYKRFHGMN